MNGRTARAGFTLVELLAGLAIAAILLLPLADMLRMGTDSARSVRATLDLNADARFALNRIATKAAAVTGVVQTGTATDPASWFAPLTYTLAGTNLVETDTSAKPVRTSVIAANVAAFRLTAPEVVAGAPLLAVELTLSAGDSTVVRRRVVRMGSQP